MSPKSKHTGRRTQKTFLLGFTLIEVMIAIGIVAIIGALSVPVFNEIQFKSEINTAKTQVIQGLETARQSAVAAKNDMEWSFFVPAGVVFPGTDYNAALTDPELAAQTITFAMPETVRFSGLEQVTYSRKGVPYISGTITLTSISGDEESVTVVLSVNPGTVTLSDPSSSAASSESSAAASSASSASSAASSSSSSNCSHFTLGSSNVIAINDNTSLTFLNIAALRQSGGEYVPTEYCYSKDSGTNFTTMFNAKKCEKFKKVSTVDPSGGESTTKTFVLGDEIVTLVQNYLKKPGSLTINDSYNSKEDVARFWYLRDGESPGPDATHTSSSELHSLLQARGYLDESGNVNIGSCELLLATEMEVLGLGSANFVDAVMRLTFF